MMGNLPDVETVLVPTLELSVAPVDVLTEGIEADEIVVADVLASVAAVPSDVPVVLDICEIVLEPEIVDSLDVDGTDVIVDAVAVLVLPKLPLVVSADVEVTVGVDDSVLPDGKVDTMLLEVAASVELELVLLGRVEAVVMLLLTPETVLPTVELVDVLSLVEDSVLSVLPDIPLKQRKIAITNTTLNTYFTKSGIMIDIT